MKQIYSWVLVFCAGLFGMNAMAQAPYCTPQTSSGCSFGDQIVNFATIGGITNITNNGTACSPNNYGDFTNMVVTVDFLGSFDIEVQSGPTWNQDQTIWIDWNQDNDFDDPGEEVWSSVTWTTALQTGTINAPGTALPGSTRMRVRCNYNAQCVDPCAQQTYGEVEDYTITILPPVQNDAGIASIINPSLPTCALDSVDVIIALQTLGTANLTSCTLNWQINGGTVSTMNYTGNVAAQGGTDTITITTNQSFANGDVLKVWSDTPNGVLVDSLPTNDTIEITLATGLAGLYTIPGDYADFNAATADLAVFGVCDSVVFSVAAGTYTEFVEVGEYLGVGPQATITFMGATGTPGDVVLEYDPSANFVNDGVLNFDGADYITFQDMTIDNLSNTFNYGRTVVMDGSSTNNLFDNCVMNGSPFNTTSFNNAVIYANGGGLHNNHFTNNTILYGSHGIYYNGDFANHTSKMSAINNQIDSFYYFGIWSYYNDTTDIIGNSVYSDNTYNSKRGIYVWDNDKVLNVENNYVGQGENGNYFYAMYVGNSDGSLNNRLRVANNCVTGGNMNYTGTSYILYLTNSGLMDVHNNTITRLADSNNTNGYCHYVINGGLISEKNNSFVTYGSDYARYVTSTYSLVESNHNNYFTNGNNMLFLNGAYDDLATFNNETGFDGSSVTTDPAFIDTLACMTCNDTLDATGDPGIVMTDIMGNVRSSVTPDIGATEFIATANFTLGDDTTVCGSTYLLESGPAQSVLWTINSTPNSNPNVTLNSTSTSPEIFNVEIDVQTACGQADDQLIVTLVPAAALDSAEHICADEVATLDPGGGVNATYSWSTGDSTATIDVNTPGTYTVNKEEMGCASTSTIVVTQSDAVDIADIEPCEANGAVSVDATINNGLSYAWSGGNSNTTALNTFDVSDIYSVTATDDLGCVSVDTFTIDFIGSPVAQITYTTAGGFGVFFSSASSQQISSNTTYEWTFNGIDNSNLANPYYLFPYNGGGATYPVTLEIDNGCDVDQIEMDITLDPVSVQELGNANGISVYPNPANNVLNIAQENAWKNAEFTLVDLSGRVVFSQEVTDGNQIVTFNLSDVASGAYSLQIVQESGSQTLPVIVE